jgi:hypothetical protein
MIFHRDKKEVCGRKAVRRKVDEGYNEADELELRRLPGDERSVTLPQKLEPQMK